jgi:HEAT repeat protein
MAFWVWQALHETSGHVGRWTRQLRNGAVEDRQEAALELGRFKGGDARAAIPALAAALGDWNEQVVIVAARSLGDAVKATAGNGDPAPEPERTALLALAAALKDTRPSVRAEVAGVLSYTAGQAAGADTVAACTQALVQAVGDPSEAVRQNVVRALGRLGDRSSDPLPRALLTALDTDPSVPVRIEAAWALGGFRAAPNVVTEALLRTLRGNDAPEVRATAARAIGQLAAGRDPIPDPLLRAVEKAEVDLSHLLDDPAPANRITALNAFQFLASRLKRDIPPPRLVASLDDPDAAVRQATIGAVVAYRTGPEALVPVALRRISKEGTGVDFTSALWRIRLEPSVLPLLMEGMSSQDVAVRQTCAIAINHMGPAAGPALPAVMNLIREELKLSRGPNTKGPDILAMASGAVGEISPDSPPQSETVELLIEVARRSAAVLHAQNRDPSLGVTKRESWSEQLLRDQNAERLGEAIWSLGILGRPAAPAIPVLLSVLETLRDTPGRNNRRVTAEALAEITRGTPDEDRVLAALAKAWTSATPQEKPVFARALRSFGPKAEQLVPELRHFPPDTGSTQIRRVRYPRP